MTGRNSLERIIDGLQAVWGPQTPHVTAKVQQLMAELARTSSTEAWMAALRREAPESHELYRDHAHGFVLLAYTEQEGRYRAPHDHGRGWVVYAVWQGEIEMGDYHRVDGAGGPRAVRTDSSLVRAGDSRLYLPGAIHDTRCISRSALVLRFTSCELREEERAGRMTTYAQRAGEWVDQRAVERAP